MNVFRLVDDFHHKFGIQTFYPEEPMFSPLPEVIDFRRRFLVEETSETCEAEGYKLTITEEWVGNPNFPKYVDGQLDVIYVAAGALLFAGLSPAQCTELFLEVQRANMSKERAKSKDDERSTRKAVFDIVKPADFVPPDIEGMLRRFGWRG